VIEQAFKIKLPVGSHTAEFQYQHGMLDLVVTRRELRPLLVRLLRLLSGLVAQAPSLPGQETPDE
jgi:acetyl-CoA carboxylase carboxyl transferase subunit beta